uniref:Uncharacterized protein n=1 Tax=Panagrolaimus superbus TaxID=310955 RepID=A0A914YQ38_9BILA
MGWHQVANDGCNLSEAVNVYCDGWPVIAGRQNYCNCHDRGTTYNSDEWDPVINWLQYGEQQMMAELADERFDVESLEIPDKVGDLLVEYRAQSLERIIEPHRYDKRANNQISRKSASRRSPKTSFTINDLLESDLSCDRYEKLFDRAKITDDSNDKPTEVVNEVIKIAPTNPQEDSDVASVDENNVNSLQELSQNETNPFRDPQQFKQFINNYFRPDENKTNTRREKIDRIKKNKEIYKKSASSRKRFSAKRVKTRDNYERTPLAIYFRDKIKIAKRAIKNIDAKVADYHSIVDAPPYMLTRNNNEKRAQRVIEVDHLTKRRDLHNVLQKVWGREKVYNCFAKGHTELTVLRDYFNNNDATNVEYFKECMGLVPVTHKEFWESLLIDKAAWNDYFGVDDRYRIPWKIWTSLLPLKN